MRRGAFTLIELIITIVIMAGIFSVIPKILSATSRSDRFATQQEALMQALSLTNLAAHLAWDANNSDHLDILQTQSTNSALDCNTSIKFRRGSYVGPNGRMCMQPYSASALGNDGEADYTAYDDIDDFDGSDINVSGRYALRTHVTYLDDTIITEHTDKITIDLSSAAAATATTNIKKLKTTARYSGKRGKPRNLGSFTYFSTNIGQISLANRSWQ